MQMVLLLLHCQERLYKPLEDGKAVGLDGLPPRLLRLAAPAIAAPLTMIFNMLITSGIFPDEWKTAKVVPIHKRDINQDHGNFRPISILSTLSKLLERHIHISFYNFHKTNNLLHLAEFGFRHIFFCETALLNILNKWTEAIDKELLNGLIFLDLCKAFDLIDHKIFLTKLQMYKCSEAKMKWFTSYLYERNQCTSFKGKLLDKLSIKNRCVTRVNTWPFIIHPFWCVENCMSANATKTKSMLIRTWKNYFHLQKIRETFL